MRRLSGIITSAKMTGTVVVLVTSYTRHPKYAKDIPTSKKFHAHTDTPLTEGMLVTIEETTPRSKTVTWKVIND